jgi:hypothetical protein
MKKNKFMFAFLSFFSVIFCFHLSPFYFSRKRDTLETVNVRKKNNSPSVHISALSSFPDLADGPESAELGLGKASERLLGPRPTRGG